MDEESGDILGYIICWIIEETMEIHNIAVSGKHKRQGIGSRLMDFMLAKAAQKGVEEIFLEVRKANTAAAGFYERYNFRRISCRKGYYSQPEDDALVYALYPGHENNPADRDS